MHFIVIFNQAESSSSTTCQITISTIERTGPENAAWKTRTLFPGYTSSTSDNWTAPVVVWTIFEAFESWPTFATSNFFVKQWRAVLSGFATKHSKLLLKKTDNFVWVMVALSWTSNCKKTTIDGSVAANFVIVMKPWLKNFQDHYALSWIFWNIEGEFEL